MNDELLRRLAEEIAKRTIIDSWPFYLVLIALSFVGTTLGAYLKARMAKRGEVAATKADADEILKHLKETTKVAKSVELSLARGDWIEREKNTVKRAKLEKLVSAAFAIASWAPAEARGVVAQEEITVPTEFNEFEMLSKLYFPELSQQTMKLARLYGEVTEMFGQLRTELIGIQLRWDLAMGQHDFAQADQIRIERSAFWESKVPLMREKIAGVYVAAHELGNAAHDLMEQLTAPIVHPG